MERCSELCEGPSSPSKAPRSLDRILLHITQTDPESVALSVSAGTQEGKDVSEMNFFGFFFGGGQCWDQIQVLVLAMQAFYYELNPHPLK